MAEEVMDAAVKNDLEDSQDEQEEEENEETQSVIADDVEPFDPKPYLEMKIKLADSSESPMFSYGPKLQDSEKRPLNCHLCRLGSFRSEWKKGHLESKLHQRHLKRRLKAESYISRGYRQFFGTKDDGTLLQFMIYAGEDIPEITDEYKDRIVEKELNYPRPKAEDMKDLLNEKMQKYNKKMPLLGLDYVFKMKCEGKVYYFCALCEGKINGEAYLHVAGAKHQANYVIKHFPQTYAKVSEGLKSIVNSNAAEQCTRNIFRVLFRKIENSLRRVRINVIDYEYFKNHKEEVIKKCNDDKHYDENSITFTDKEIDDLISKCLKNIEIIKPDLQSLETPKLGSRFVVHAIVGDSNQKKINRDEPVPKMRRSESNEWVLYHQMLANIQDELNRIYQGYADYPRSHPEHNQALNAFRRGNIRDKSKSPFDYASDWNSHWKKIVRQLYWKDLDNRKRELRNILNLQNNRSDSPMRQMDRQVRAERNRWLPQHDPQQNQQLFGTRNFNQDRPMPIFTEDTPIVSSEPLSVISVMRLLSALEDQLGSLGPQAVQLLSRAVLCEKDTGNTDGLLIENDFYVFFATVKEKFRGQLQANVVDHGKIRAVNHCVNEITEILSVMDRALAAERRNQERREQQREQRQQREQANRQQYQQQQMRQQQRQWSQPQSFGDAKFKEDMSNNQWDNRRGQKRNIGGIKLESTTTPSKGIKIEEQIGNNDNFVGFNYSRNDMNEDVKNMGSYMKNESTPMKFHSTPTGSSGFSGNTGRNQNYGSLGGSNSGGNSRNFGGRNNSGNFGEQNSRNFGDGNSGNFGSGNFDRNNSGRNSNSNLGNFGSNYRDNSSSSTYGNFGKPSTGGGNFSSFNNSFESRNEGSSFRNNNSFNSFDNRNDRSFGNDSGNRRFGGGNDSFNRSFNNTGNKDAGNKGFYGSGTGDYFMNMSGGNLDLNAKGRPLGGLEARDFGGNNDNFNFRNSSSFNNKQYSNNSGQQSFGNDGRNTGFSDFKNKPDNKSGTWRFGQTGAFGNSMGFNNSNY